MEKKFPLKYYLPNVENDSYEMLLVTDPQF